MWQWVCYVEMVIHLLYLYQLFIVGQHRLPMKHERDTSIENQE